MTVALPASVTDSLTWIPAKPPDLSKRTSVFAAAGLARASDAAASSASIRAVVTIVIARIVTPT